MNVHKNGKYFISGINKLFLMLMVFSVLLLFFLNFTNVFEPEKKADVVNAHSLMESDVKSDSLIELSVVEKAILAAQNSSGSTVSNGYAGNASDEYPTIMGSPQMAQEIKDWHRSRGYYVMNFFGFPEDEYASYSMDTLRHLKESGDLRAHAFFARKLSDGTQEGYLKSRDEFMELAARGSIEALHLSGFLTKSSDGRFTGLTKRENVLDYLALYKVAEMRGSRLPMIEAYSSIEYGEVPPLSKVEWQQVEARAKEVYEGLAKKRQELGLGDFDNSVPDSVKMYFEGMGGKEYYHE